MFTTGPRAVGFTIVWPEGVIFSSMMTYHVQFLLLVLAGWVNRQQQDVIDYLQEENRVLRAGLRGKPSCPKTQTNSRLARRAVSIVINPWRAPDQGRVGGDVGDSGSPHAQGKHRPATGCYAPWAKTWIQVLGKDGH